MSILHPIFFCEPGQILVFLTILGALSGIYTFAKEKWKKPNFKKMNKKGLYFFSILIYIFYLYAFYTAYTSPFVIILITIIYFSIIFLLIETKKTLIYVLILIVLTSYFISGITGNACLFLPLYHHGIELGAGSTDIINFSASPDITSRIDCPASGILIDKIQDGYVQINILNKENKTIITTWISENEDLTLCTFQSRLNKIDNTLNLTEWQFMYKDDIFSNINGYFSVKGIYYKIK